jgi:tetratricopeptide (TPR) repeat protein
MLVDAYRGFAKSILRDVAERRNSEGKKVPRGRRRVETVSDRSQAVRLRGDTTTYLTDPGYRDSDASFRLTMAVLAMERVFEIEKGKKRGAKRWACQEVAEFILTSKGLPLRDRFMQGNRGPKRQTTAPEATPDSGWKRRSGETGGRSSVFAELDELIEDADRGQSHHEDANLRRLANTIRSQTGQFRSRNQETEKQFDAWFGAYRSEKWQDADWYQQAEAEYRRRVKAAVDQFGPNDHWTAMAYLNLARLLEEMEKFREAVGCYKSALDSWQNAVAVSETRREKAIQAIAAGLKHCETQLQPLDTD